MFTIPITINPIDITLTIKTEKPQIFSGYFSSINIDSLKLKGVLKIMALSMKNTQKAEGTLAFVDSKGSVTDAASVEIVSSDTNVATVTYDDPTNKVTVVAGQAGVAALTITAKNSKGDVLPFDDVAVEITAGDAVSGSIQFGEPVEQ